MKIVGIGDIHGRSVWKEIVKKEKDVDKFVFQGDYFDSKEDYSGSDQLNNYNEIVAFKEANPEQVILLFGNHDFHYLSEMKQRYSGFQSVHSIDFEIAIERDLNKKNIQMAYMADDILFTHAGITKTWLNNMLNRDVLNNETIDLINDYLYYSPSIFKFNSGPNASRSGDDVTQPPIWVRPYSLSQDKFDIWYSIGHTQVEEVSIVDKHKIVLTDCLGFKTAYAIFENGEPKSS